MGMSDPGGQVERRFAALRRDHAQTLRQPGRRARAHGWAPPKSRLESPELIAQRLKIRVFLRQVSDLLKHSGLGRNCEGPFAPFPCLRQSPHLTGVAREVEREEGKRR